MLGCGPCYLVLRLSALDQILEPLVFPDFILECVDDMFIEPFEVSVNFLKLDRMYARLRFSFLDILCIFFAFFVHIFYVFFSF